MSISIRGIIKPKISNVFLTQDLQLKFKPGQEKWNKGKAEQYFTIQPPAFNHRPGNRTAGGKSPQECARPRRGVRHGVLGNDRAVRSLS